MTANNLQMYVQVKTIGKVLVPLEGTTMIFSKVGKSSDVIPDDRTFPGLCTTVPELSSQTEHSSTRRTSSPRVAVLMRGYILLPLFLGKEVE